MVNKSKVVKTDIVCNGVIHVIHAVLLPETKVAPAGPAKLNWKLRFPGKEFGNHFF